MNLDFFENKYFFAVFSIFMFMYAVQIRPTLPKFMMDLFQNPIFRVAILFLILVRGYKDPQFSLIVAVAFLLIMNVVNEQLFQENFADSQLPIVNTPTVAGVGNQQQVECMNLQQKLYDIDDCLNRQDVVDCSTKSGTDKENCEKNNDEMVGLKATLGRRKYTTSEEFNNKCTGVLINVENKPSANLVCKNL